MELVQNTGIIFSLDVIRREEAFGITEEINEFIDAIKVGYLLVLSCGIGIIDELKKEFGKPILADFKVADVPVTNKKIFELCKMHSVDAVMVHGFIGPVTLNMCVEEAGDLLLSSARNKAQTRGQDT